jgi:7-carboxy-7-deazaguanine synthase
MLGTNEVAHAIDPATWDGVYKITDVWPTIQGEGPFSGFPAIFIRLAECNLRCTWCDTTFGVNYLMTSDEILSRVKTVYTGQPLIVITGGEPLLQPIRQLINVLSHALSYIGIQIETAGTVYPENLTETAANLHIVVSPKTPIINEHIRALAQFWKYVISINDDNDEKTGIPITSTQLNGNKAVLALPPPWIASTHIFLQPMEGEHEDLTANYQKVAQLAMKYNYRASVRLHSILGLP